MSIDQLKKLIMKDALQISYSLYKSFQNYYLVCQLEKSKKIKKIKKHTQKSKATNIKLIYIKNKTTTEF